MRIRHWLILFLLISVSGCGFHLRGSNSQPLSSIIQQVYIKGIDTESGFGRDLAEALEIQGVKILTEENRQYFTLLTEKLQETQKILSVDSNVRGREFALVSQIKFALLPPDSNDQAVKYQTISVRRDLVRDPKAVLGSDLDEFRLRQEMRKELAQLVILRLRWN